MSQPIAGRRVIALPRVTPIRIVACLALACSARGEAQFTVGTGVAAAPLSVGPVHFEASGAVNQMSADGGPLTMLTMRTTAALDWRTGGLSLGVAARRSSALDSMPHAALLSAGVWHGFGDITIRVDAQSQAARLGGHPGTLRVEELGTDSALAHLGNAEDTTSDPAEGSKLVLWSELQATVSMTIRRVRLDATLGARPAVETYSRAVWASLTSAVPITSRLSLVAAVGTTPRQIALGVPASRFAIMGFSISRGRSASDTMSHGHTTAPFSIRADTAGRRIISYQADGVRRVELSGDFDQWVPISMQEVRPGIWEAALPLAAGTYRMNLRVDDGGWFAPPGAAVITDDFGGTVGLVVVH